MSHEYFRRETSRRPGAGLQTRLRRLFSTGFRGFVRLDCPAPDLHPDPRRLRHSLEDVSQHPSRSGPGHKPWSCSGCFGSKRLFLWIVCAWLSPSGRQHRADNHNQSCQALTRSKRSLLSAFRVVCHGRSFAINRIGSPSGGLGVPSTWPVTLQCRVLGTFRRPDDVETRSALFPGIRPFGLWPIESRTRWRFSGR
jgi:hypothetical protein